MIQGITIGEIIELVINEFAKKGLSSEDTLRVYTSFNDRFKQKYYLEYITNQTTYINHRNTNFQRYLQAYYGVELK